MIDKARLIEIIKKNNAKSANGSKYISFLLGEIIFYSNAEISNIDFDKLETVIELACKSQDHSLLTGSLGVTWALRDLCNKKILNHEEIIDFDTEIDVVFENEIDWYFQNKNYDLFDGMIGKGLYFLETKKAGVVEKIVDCLDKIKRVKNGTFFWIDYKQGKNICDLGLAHGIPSIISFLSSCYHSNIKKEKCSELIEGAVAFALQIYKESHNSLPHSIVTETFSPMYPTSRLAWCYGNLSLAVCLWNAGAALGDHLWQNTATDIMFTASRVSVEESGVFFSVKSNVYDIGFCHGTSGIAHIFHRFYQVTKTAVFLNRANYWLDLTLIHMEKEHVLFPYELKKDIWKSGSASLLEGINGVGMVVMSFLESEKNLSWDKIFFTNMSS